MPDFDLTLIFFSILFSSIGFVYYAHGKENGIYFRITGILLFLFPYVVDKLWQMVILGVFLMALPFILNHFLPLD